MCRLIVPAKPLPIDLLFISTVEKYPSRELYFYKKNDSWIGLTGEDVKITVEDIAFGLRALGIQKKSNIAILSNNSPRWAMCDYGIICSAMTTVTIYPTLIPKQIDFILRDSNAEFILLTNFLCLLIVLNSTDFSV